MIHVEAALQIATLVILAQARIIQLLLDERNR
jgi:hypothetical protein